MDTVEDADPTDPEVREIVQLASGLWMTTTGRIPTNVAVAHAEAAP